MNHKSGSAFRADRQAFIVDKVSFYKDELMPTFETSVCYVHII